MRAVVIVALFWRLVKLSACSSTAQGIDSVPLFMDGGRLSCRALTSINGTAVGSFCLRFSATKSDKLFGDFAIQEQGWVLDTATLWFGINATDFVQYTDENEPGKYRNTQDTIGISRASFTLSLAKSVGFVCPNGPRDLFAVAHATIRRRSDNLLPTIEVWSEGDRVPVKSFTPYETATSFPVACMELSSGALLSHGPDGDVSMAHRKDERGMQACETEPQEIAPSFSLSVAFVQRMGTAMDLFNILQAGDTNDTAHRETYEMFKSWVDFNDAHLVAKTIGEDPACYVILRGTHSFNPLGWYPNLTHKKCNY